MSIRNAAKAIIVHENKVLLNQSHRENFGDYFILPGGGQNPYETMEEAVIRECLEETGYTVHPETLVAVHEEIYTNKHFRLEHPDYSHKCFHVFRCSLAVREKAAPSELDANQTGSVWLDINDIPSIRLYPARIHEHFHRLLQTDMPLYLGASYVTF